MTEEMLKAIALMAAAAELFHHAGESTTMMRKGVELADKDAIDNGGRLLSISITAAHTTLAEAQRLLQMQAHAELALAGVTATPKGGMVN